jgi:hypothetical protein
MDNAFSARVWLYQNKGSWHFVTLPKEVAAGIREQTAHLQKAFGSLRVAATIGKTRWQTSLFFDTKAGSYYLPLKAAVRAKEQLRVDDEIEVSVRVIG